MNKETIYLVAKRDVEDFTIVDDDGYELTFSLKAGSKLKIYEVVCNDDSEIWVKLYRDDEAPCYVLADDFSIIVERRA